MSNGNPASLHGGVGTGLGNFSRLSPADAAQPGESELRELASVTILIRRWLFRFGKNRTQVTRRHQ